MEVENVKGKKKKEAVNKVGQFKGSWFFFLEYSPTSGRVHNISLGIEQGCVALCFSGSARFKQQDGRERVHLLKVGSEV